MSFHLDPALTNPAKFHDPLDLTGFTLDELLSRLWTMKLVRAVELMIASKRQNGDIGGPVHLGVGQEAVAVGISSSLQCTDRVFGAHRSHSHAIALGSSIRSLFAEVLGKETGLSKGMGGSMHLWDKPRGFYGSVPIVSGTVPLAVGAGLAAKLSATNDIAVAYFGDGAMEEGVVHESLNLAKVLNIPILFVVENNLFSSHMHISLRQPGDSLSRFAASSFIPFVTLDGNDVLAVSSAAAAFIKNIRSGQGPGFIEAVTYRWYGHVDWREDIDVGVNRSVHDLEGWRSRDPVARLATALHAHRLFSHQDEQLMDQEIEDIVQSSWLSAVADPYPESAALLDRVYSA